jgi:hypothetical protein
MDTTKRQALAGRHPLECLQRRIDGVPRQPADAVGEGLRHEAVRVVQAGRVDRDQVRNGGNSSMISRGRARAHAQEGMGRRGA